MSGLARFGVIAGVLSLLPVPAQAQAGLPAGAHAGVRGPAASPIPAQQHLAGTLVDHTKNHGCDRRIWAAALGEKRDLYVYLPPGFNPSCRYPVMIWLHGIIQDEKTFIDSGLKEIDAEMAAGRMPPTIIAIPDGSELGRFAVFVPQPLWLNSKVGNFEDYVVQDVWGFVQEHYPIRPERQAHVLAGFSGGGAAAYRISIKHRDQFAVAAGVAAPLNFRWIDCHGRYFTHFDPDCWGWRERILGHEVVGRFYGVILIRLGQLIFPLYGRGPQAVEMMARENPIEMLDSHNVCPGELAMFVAYGGKDEFNLGAQIESFLFRAKQRGLCVEVGFDPEGHHNHELAVEFMPRLAGWLLPLLAPYAPPPK